jgi:GDSL-like Lipase/Acylhydrolase family
MSARPANRWNTTIITLLAFLAVTVAHPVAAAQAVAPAPPAAPEQTGPWEPDPRVDDLTVPGSGRKVKPFTEMTPPTTMALPGFERSPGVMRGVAGPEDPPEQWCIPRIAKSVSVQRQSLEPTNAVPDPQGDVATVDYFGDLTCNFQLYAASGVAGLVDRTPRFEKTLHMGGQLVIANHVYGSSAGVFSIPGERYDGGRSLEVLFELFLYDPWSKWGSCPGPQVIVYVCEGLGTNTVHLVLGSGTFGSGLNPAVVRLVSLGESYASGLGAGSYDSFPDWCHRSANSYARKLNGRRNLNGIPVAADQRACHGATNRHIIEPQIGPISGLSVPKQTFWLNRYTTRLATVSTGGNDLGFASKLKTCIIALTDFCGGFGAPLISPTELAVTQTNLVTIYRTILSEIRPDGQLVVLTYPRIFPKPGETTAGCSTVLRNSISANELVLLENAWTAAREMIHNAVRAVGGARIRIVEMLDAFAGHNICNTVPWARELVDPISGDLVESFHPNDGGHTEYARRIAQVLTLS